MTTYLEISKSDHGHGGLGLEFGTCLWSPSRNKSGVDRYSIMRKPRPGDRVIHIYNIKYNELKDTFILGQSIVARSYVERVDEPPTPGRWSGMSPYYRVDLKEYSDFVQPLPIRTLLQDYSDEIKDDLLQNKPKFYPFNTNLNDIRTVQGIYLARATGTLEAILTRALELERSKEMDSEFDTHQLFFEAKRLQRERYFFARNSKLSKMARERDNYRCRACNFTFSEKYKDIGKGFIEAHHANPLSERPEIAWSESLATNLDDVISLCSNCHRMIHRRRPAYTLDELQQFLF